jgi:hypothetical protein
MSKNQPQQRLLINICSPVLSVVLINFIFVTGMQIADAIGRLPG